MRWHANDAAEGTTRTRRIFCWFPTRVPWYKDPAEVVWLESIVVTEEMGYFNRWRITGEAK